MIIQKYLYKNISSQLSAILCILTLLFLLLAYFHFVSEAAASRLSSEDIMKLLITEIPVLLQPILPISFFLAILLAFRKMYADNEILSMYAAGIKEIKLYLPIIVICLLLTGFSLYMQLHIFPLANTKRIHLLEDSLHNATFDKLYSKQFNELIPGNVIYFNKKNLNPKRLENVFFSHIVPDEYNKLTYDVIIAKSMSEEKSIDNARIVLFTNGIRYVANFNNRESLKIKFDKLGYKISNANYRIEDWPGCMKIKELFIMSKIDRYAAAEFHWRLSIPISIINLTLFAIALNQGRICGYRHAIAIFYPILIYLIYINLLLTCFGLIKTGLISKEIGLWGVHAAMFIFCCFSFKYKPS